MAILRSLHGGALVAALAASSMVVLPAAAAGSPSAASAVAGITRAAEDSAVTITEFEVDSITGFREVGGEEFQGLRRHQVPDEPRLDCFAVEDACGALDVVPTAEAAAHTSGEDSPQVVRVEVPGRHRIVRVTFHPMALDRASHDLRARYQVPSGVGLVDFFGGQGTALELRADVGDGHPSVQVVLPRNLDRLAEAVVTPVNTPAKAPVAEPEPTEDALGDARAADMSVAEREAADDENKVGKPAPTPTSLPKELKDDLKEAQEHCKSGARSPLCGLDEQTTLAALQKGKVIADDVVASKDFRDARKEFKLPPRKVHEFADIHKNTKGALNKLSRVPKIKDAIKNVRPSTGVKILWAASAVMALVDKNATTADKIEAVLSGIPYVGSVFAFGNSASKGDIEGMLVASISLAATAVTAVFPPAGAVIGLALATYQVCKMFLTQYGEEIRNFVQNLFWQKFVPPPDWNPHHARDWVADPPNGCVGVHVRRWPDLP